MPPVGFEPTISAGERPKTYALDRAPTGTGEKSNYGTIKNNLGTYTKYTKNRVSCQECHNSLQTTRVIFAGGQTSE